ncbi:hypothetical protein JOC77_002420 [Peribacillus deserti]|uniref:Transposase n=1 Tax=Peribacillus deserti TaxID=673318 RepID=A0ABS2QJT3_9BACI|nr:hypothetical protein [Peribacillus deserti]MBM7692989.1 hypothetical protein [Peribacillus deserti]
MSTYFFGQDHPNTGKIRTVIIGIYNKENKRFKQAASGWNY